MSLFGDDAPSTPSRHKKSSSNLFESSPKRTSSLFNEENNASGDPWSLPTPKRAARSTLIKTLLKPGDVPDAYVDVFDKLLDESDGHAVDIGAIRRLVRRAKLQESVGKKIEKIVVTNEQAGLERGEVWVLLALIGLAQEGEEELTLDAVDERNKNLPSPDLGDFLVKPPPRQSRVDEEVAQSASHAERPSDEPRKETIRRPPSPASPDKPSRSAARQSFGYPDADPWSSPDLHRNHNHPKSNGLDDRQHTVAPTQRTTSSFTTHSEPQDTASTRSQAAPTRTATTTSGGWDNYSSPAEPPFTSPDPTSGGFGEPPEQDSSSNRHANTFSAPRILPNSTEEVITVTALSEMEGMFLFQHRNYQITSVRRNSKVIRRYSDFVWLLDCLHKRYPFRQLPLLPPKRVAINGNYIAADSSFVEKRRRGLARFANALVRHPVVGQEQLVVMFLTVPTELAVWRKQASISVQEEFIGKSLPPTLEDSLPPNLQDLFDRVRTGVRRSAEQYIHLCNNIERKVKLNGFVAAEYTRIAASLQTLTTVSADTYAADTGELVGLNIGLTSVAKHYNQSQALLQDEARAWDEGVLEDLKRQRDGLVSIRDMFERRDRYDRDNIPQLEKRIKQNEEKLVAIRNKPAEAVKPGEAERVEELISKDKQSIVDQHARGVFIRECIRDEIMHFQNSQYHVSRLQQDWAAERVKYAELQADNWRALSDEVEAMPLGES